MTVMTDLTSEPVSFRPCRRCGALVGVSARYCGVCGTAAAERAPSDQPGRGRLLLFVSALSLVLIFAGVAWIYFSAPQRRQEHAVSHLASGAPYAIAILPGNPPLTVSVTGGLASASTNQGAEWQRLPLQGTVKVVAAGAGPEATIYLAGSQLWRGGAAGVQPVATSFPLSALRALAVDPLDSRRVYAAVVGKGLYESDNSGGSWSLLNPDVPSDTTSLTATGGKAGFVFLGTSTEGIFGSVAGDRWSNASGFVNGALPTHAIAALAFDPKSGDQYVGPSGDTMSGALYAGTDRGVFKSIDGGRSWSALPFQHPVQALAVDPSGSHLMIAVDANGDVYRSSDDGNSWQ